MTWYRSCRPNMERMGRGRLWGRVLNKSARPQLKQYAELLLAADDIDALIGEAIKTYVEKSERYPPSIAATFAGLANYQAQKGPIQWTVGMAKVFDSLLNTLEATEANGHLSKWYIDTIRGEALVRKATGFKTVFAKMAPRFMAPLDAFVRPWDDGICLAIRTEGRLWDSMFEVSLLNVPEHPGRFDTENKVDRMALGSRRPEPDGFCFKPPACGFVLARVRYMDMPHYGTTWLLRISTDPAIWVRDQNSGGVKAPVVHYFEEDDPALQKDLKAAAPLTPTPAIDRGTLMAIGFLLQDACRKARVDVMDTACKEWPSYLTLSVVLK